MTHSLFGTRQRLLVYFFIIVLPFLLFYTIVPFLSDMTMGNDYLRYSIRNQIELLFSIKTGSFPLYVPGFASGHSSSALTLGQIYHPLPYIASMMPGYWDGKAIEWNSFLKLLSLGFTHLILFAFLRKLKLNSVHSFLFSFITVYNLKLLDLFRHGAPLEAYTGHLILCSVVGWQFIRRTKWTGYLCIIGATYLLICCGHPEEMYYGLLGSVLFTGVAPFFISAMLPDTKVDFKIALGFWLRTGGCFLIGIMLSSAYILPFYFEFISENTLRVGQSYAQANSDLDSFVGTINNFFLPLRSLVYGAFGGSSLILIPVVLPLLRFFKVKIPRSIWLIWGSLLFMFLFIQGNRTPVHRWVWDYLPFASSIRTAGRISMIMPFFMMLLLAWAVKAEQCSLRIKRAFVSVRPVTLLAGFSLLLAVSYYLVYVSGYYIFSSGTFLREFRYPVGHINNMSYFWIELMAVIAGMSSLMVLAFYNARSSSAKVLGFLLLMLSVIQVGTFLNYRVAHWIEKKYASPTLAEMQKQKKISLDYLYYPGYGMYSSVVINQLNRSFMEPFLGKIYTQIVPVEDQNSAYEKMQSRRLPQQLFIEGYDPEKAEIITGISKSAKEGTVSLTYSSFNCLRFKVTAESAAFFGLSYPYTGNWNATVNREKTRVFRANGAAHAVEIPEGESIIEFRYWSGSAFWGMFISCTVFVLTGFLVCVRSFKGMPRITGILLMLTIGAGVFILWYNSLYTGNNLQTGYTWTYARPLKTPNMAYGKKTWARPTYRICSVCEHDLSYTRVVDGDRTLDSGFTSILFESPALTVDLQRPEMIQTVVLYENDQNPEVHAAHPNIVERVGKYSTASNRYFFINIRPLQLDVSDDGKIWRNVFSVVSPIKTDGPTRISFEKPQYARYVRITASGKSQLSLDEVEIYGPKNDTG